MRTRDNLRRGLLSAAATILTIPSVAAAQQAAGSHGAATTPPIGGAALEEVVVTARRVNERLQSVPVAVTALSDTALRQGRVQQVSDLRLLTPSLQITPDVNGSAIPGITLRGQRAARSLIGQDPAIAFYTDEVPNTRPAGLDTSVYDLSSVQVIKGPQGTLFGRNTTGGAILIETKRPTFQREGYVQATLGNYNDREGEGAINIPVNDKLALRLAGNVLRRDGYAVNGITGQDLFDRRSESARLSVLFRPTDTVENLTVADMYHSHSHGSLPHSLGLLPGPLPILDAAGRLQTPAGTAAASAARVTASSFDYIESEVLSSEKTQTYGLANITTLTLNDHLTFKNIAGFHTVTSDLVGDFDGTAAQGIAAHNESRAQYGSDELQLAGNWDRIKFVSGLFFYRETGRDNGIAKNFQPRGSDAINVSGGSAMNNSYSAFVQSDWEFAPHFTLTTGVRYTIDQREVTPKDNTVQTIPRPSSVCGTRNPSTGVPNVYPNCGVPLRTTFKEPTYNFSLNWQPDTDLLLYIAHRRGYRAGGFNVRAKLPVEYEPFSPEIVKDVEVGVKYDFHVAGVSGRINAAAYQQWYKDIQRTVTVFDTVSNSTGSVVFNAAQATIKGAEVETTLIPVQNLTISGFYAYTHPRYGAFINPANGQDLSANLFSNVPEHQGSATIRYTWPLQEGDISVSGTIYAQGDFQLADINVPGFYAHGYHLFNARIDWHNIGGRRVDLAVFGQNLGNEQYITSGTVTPAAGYAWAYPGAPRMWGVQIRYEF